MGWRPDACLSVCLLVLWCLPAWLCQCGSLSFWLDELGVRQVDFLSLDVEGFELQVRRQTEPGCLPCNGLTP